MKPYIAILLLFLTGCSSNVQTVTSQLNAQTAALTKERAANVAIKKQAANYSYQATYALQHADQTQPVKVAEQLLTLNSNLVGQSDNEVALQKQVDDLLAQNAQAKQDLADMQEENNLLSGNLVKAQTALDTTTATLHKTALSEAAKADKLASYDSWFGLSGLFHYFFHSLLVFGIIAAVLVVGIFVLNLLASGNPLAASILAGFELVASYPIKFILWALPGVTKFVGKEITVVEGYIKIPPWVGAKPSSVVPVAPTASTAPPV